MVYFNLHTNVGNIYATPNRKYSAKMTLSPEKREAILTLQEMSAGFESRVHKVRIARRLLTDAKTVIPEDDAEFHRVLNIMLTVDNYMLEKEQEAMEFCERKIKEIENA